MTPLPPPVCGFKTSPCVRSKRPRVYRHHAHMKKHMCAWWRHTRRRLEWTHGGVSESTYGFSSFFFSVPQHKHTHQTHTTTTTKHTTQHNNTQHHTETETERDRNRERQRKRETEKEKQRRRDKRRRDKKREETRRRKRREERQDKRRVRPSNPPDELAQNVSKKNPPGRIIPPFFFESSESYRIFNYLHDLNSIFRAGGIKSENVFGYTVGLRRLKDKSDAPAESRGDWSRISARSKKRTKLPSSHVQMGGVCWRHPQ